MIGLDENWEQGKGILDPLRLLFIGWAKGEEQTWRVHKWRERASLNHGWCSKSPQWQQIRDIYSRNYLCEHGMQFVFFFLLVLFWFELLRRHFIWIIKKNYNLSVSYLKYPPVCVQIIMAMAKPDEDQPQAATSIEQLCTVSHLSVSFIIHLSAGLQSFWYAFFSYYTQFIFVMECIAKLAAFGSREYFADNWNRLDFIVVMEGITSAIIVSVFLMNQPSHKYLVFSFCILFCRA